MTPKPIHPNPTILDRDPYAAASLIGIDVVHRPLTGYTGMWLPDENLIVIRDGMRAVHDRSTLAHELGHAVCGHRHSSRLHEAVADREAACFLIDRDRFVRACLMYDYVEDVAAECGVSTRLARVFARAFGRAALP